MTGTSLDGIDAALISLDPGFRFHGLVSAPLSDALRSALFELQQPGPDELHRSAIAAQQLAREYANAVHTLLAQHALKPQQVAAIGAHGQTVRHAPHQGYTTQINQPALLAELTSIDVVADFRSRDIAASGQGAPLVPTFHAGVFRSTEVDRVIANIGGISNISILPKEQDAPVRGHDTGPGNMLIDAWMMHGWQRPYDAGGGLAAQGQVQPELLNAMLSEPFFAQPAPKSTGRDLFNQAWLAPFALEQFAPLDVLTTLTELTAISLARDVMVNASQAAEMYVCGGGALNKHLIDRLQQHLPQMRVKTTDDLGLPTQAVEACAFAWLAHQCLQRIPANMPSVTGARGLRVLGALYPR